jgi:hypothetical protein
MIMTTGQLMAIAGAGGGLVLDASTLTFTQIRDVSAAAAGGKATITVKNFSSLTATQLVELAQLASGLITFDLTS